MNKFLFSPDYWDPPDGLFIDTHPKVTDEGQISEPTSWVTLLR